ncbi:ADP-ribosylglycohydrolase family protein [Agromyces sp. MMS24-JH15]|uniref:5' nucleotidase, NT5C type n=1 Tax=Agromyces sp. MMS24-JH15 TaxID=3243765 RepID=UPI0037487DB4
MTTTPFRLDRAVGAVLASAAGDALGSQYEFGPALPDDAPVTFGIGHFGHAEGEWTDDTSMAVPLLQALARGESLNDAIVLGRIPAEWREWARTSRDVGAQTRAVLARLPEHTTEDASRAAAEAEHRGAGRSGGNGSLMRTGPIALGYLADGAEAALVDAAGRVARLTHWEDDNVDATALWCLAIRHAIRTGDLDVHAGLVHLPAERRARWSALIDEALVPGAHPRDFSADNGWVVRAFQAALAAVNGASSLPDALERAVRGGNDTDTVAAIAGSLAGARFGGSAVPLTWQRRLHGWPDLRAEDLIRLAVLAARGGSPDAIGWPTATSAHRPGFRHTPARRHPHDDGVWLGSQSALADLPEGVDFVVSLCRIGTDERPAGIDGLTVWLIDEDGANLDTDGVLADTADLIADLRADGRRVFVHCAEARSRTAAVAALYSARHRDIPITRAWRVIEATLPDFAPAPFLRAAVDRVAAASAATSTPPARKIVYIDLDNTLVDFPSAFDRVAPELLEEYTDRRDEIPGIFALMDPMPGAIEAYRQLAAVHDVYILSTAPWLNPSAWSDKLEWVQRHLGVEKGTPAYKRLILSHHKDLNRGDYLVDDRPNNGADRFDGTWLHFGPGNAFPTWESVTGYLLGGAAVV